MSSYGEFKKDVGNAAAGVAIVVIATLTFQLTLVIVSLILMLLVLGIYKLFGGTNKQTKEELKALCIIVPTFAFIIWFAWWWYNNMMYH